jgi:hypothetical protein
MGKVSFLMEMGNAGKAQVVVRSEQCEGGVKLSLVEPGAGEPANTDGCTRRTGPPFVFDPAGLRSGTMWHFRLSYPTLTATVTQAPAVARPDAQQKAPDVARSVTTLISVSDAQQAKVVGAEITLVGLTPGLPAQAKIITTGESGGTALQLEPGRYHYEVDAQGFKSAKGEFTIAPGQVRQDLEVPLTAAPNNMTELLDAFFGPSLGVGPLGSGSVGVGFGTQSFGNLTMLKSGDAVADSFNGAPISTTQNTSSVEQQNTTFVFSQEGSGPGFQFNAGLGRVAVGDQTLSFGGGFGVIDTGITLDYQERQDVQGFTSRSFDANGPFVEFSVGAALRRAVKDQLRSAHWKDRVALWARLGIGKADLDDPVPSPGFAAAGVTEVEADGRILVETFNVTTGARYAVENVAATLAYRYSSVDVTLARGGKLQASVPQGTLLRVYSFESEFHQGSHQLFGGVDVRVWRRLWASVSGAIGGGSNSVGFGVRYVRNK